MFEKIQKELTNNDDIKAWNIRHVTTLGSQQYDLEKTTEAIRQVNAEHFSIDVLCDAKDKEGKTSSGTGTVTILPGAEVKSAIDLAVLTAKLVHNQPYDFPEPGPIPEVDLADKNFQKDPAGSLEGVLKSLKSTTADFPNVRLTAAEVFGQDKTTHLVSSKGIDAVKNSTEIYLQWIYIAGSGENEVETFAEVYRRRISDLKLGEEAAKRAQYTSDLLVAETAPSITGPVYVQGSTLATMVAGEILAGNLFQILADGSMKYSGETPWEIGKSIFRGDVKGDPFQLWANRQLPYGMQSNAFDKEGIGAQRILLVDENKLQAYTTSQRYAQYLDVPATGEFGNLELPAGKTPDSDLKKEPHIEISEFSWFNPNPVSGDFSSEIRLGFIVENGIRKPFKGGLLIGNLLDALADVHWSAETDFYGNYSGPKSARFNQLQVAGK